MLYVMSKWKHYVTSSLGGVRCCDDTVLQADPANPVGWRALVSSITCVLDGGGNRTGYANVATLQQYYLNNSLPTGTTKPNTIGDANYIPNYIDTSLCEVGTPPVEDTGLITFENYVTCKGILDITGPDIANRPFVPHTSWTESFVPGVYDFHITTYDPSDSTVPVPCTIVVNGLLQDSEGDTTVTAVHTPIVIEIRPVDYMR
jgi:hypothetical protein